MTHCSTIRIAAVGDISFGDHPLCLGFGVRSVSEKKGVLFPLQQVREQLASYDVVLGNLETVLSDAGLQHSLKSRQMRGLPDSVECLASAGFTAVSLANNHAMQHGRAAFMETVSLLKAHGISPIGVNVEDCRKAIPTIISVKGIRLGLLGYSLRPRQHSPEPPLYTEGEPKAMLADIRALAGQVDLVVVSVHWGDEFVPYPSPGEILLARQMVEAGASIILGHHPHILRGIERYRDAIICHSLGNFVFDMPWDKNTSDSCIVEIPCNENMNTKYDIHPIQINYTFQPEQANGAQAERIRREMQSLSEKLLSDVEPLPLNGALSRYEAACRRELRRHQWSRRRFFLTHLLKYDREIMRQQLSGWLKGRLCTR